MDVIYEIVCKRTGEVQAISDSKKDAIHYLATYGQDEEYELYEVTRYSKLIGRAA